MAVKVVDASALAALLFGEPAAEAVAVQLEEALLVARVLLGFEVANVCLTKARRHPEQRTALVSAFAGFARMPIELIDIDFADAIQLAEASGLTFYDAAYLWLARRFDAELVTLDREVQDAVSALLGSRPDA